MAEYYSVLKRAVGGLDPNVPEYRRAVYDKARNALIGQLKAVDPPLTTAEISRQRLELEEAIRRVEREITSELATEGHAAATSKPPARQPGAAPREPAAGPREPAAAPYAPEAPAAAAGHDYPPDNQSPDAAQDGFRRAMEEAQIRGAESAMRGDRGRPPSARGSNAGGQGEPVADMGPRAGHYAPVPPAARRPPPPEPDSRGPAQYRDRQEAYPEEPYSPPHGRGPEEYQSGGYAGMDARTEGPRLAPEYDEEWNSAGHAQGPANDPRERAPVVGRGRRPDYAESDDPEALEDKPPRRRSRIARLVVWLVIVAVVAVIAYAAWTQRAIVGDLIAGLTGGSSGDTPQLAETVDSAPAAVDDSGKNTDRLLEGEPEPDRAVRVIDAPATEAIPIPGSDTGDTADDGALALTEPIPSVPEASTPTPAVTGAAQKAMLFEEAADGSTDSVNAIDADVTWRFVENGPNGPEIEANLEVPDRGMKVRFALHRNTDSSLPASHLVEVIIDTPANFPGQGISTIPRVVLKPSEEARGEPLVGAAAKVADGFFWIALSSAEDDVATNIALIEERNWIDLPIVYETGQRAILTFEKGGAGEQVFQQAIAAWNAG